MTEPGFHGDLLGPSEPMSGPVVIRIPAWATPEQVRQFERWAEASGRALGVPVRPRGRAG
jgi:hypothetical protein